MKIEQRHGNDGAAQTRCAGREKWTKTAPTMVAPVRIAAAYTKPGDHEQDAASHLQRGR